jgi:DNA polymerase-3 subunit delta
MPSLPGAKLLQRLANGQIDPLYLLCGDETYLIQEYTAACIDRILAAAPRDFNCDVFYADGDTLFEALSIARTLPMMARYRVVVLHEVHKLRKAELRQLEAYADQPSETAALICTSTEGDPRKFPDRLWRQALVVECKRLEGTQLRAWVVNMVERQGYAITPEAVQEFLRDQQNDLWTIAREIEKLCTYAGDTRRIGLAEVQEVCQSSQLHSIFMLSDAIGTRRIVQAFSVIDSLLHQGEPPLVIFGMIVRHLRLLWSIRLLVQQDSNLVHIAKTLHLPLRVCRQLVDQSRLFSAERLRRLFTAAVEADVAFKTTNKPPKAVLEGLILDLCLGS